MGEALAELGRAIEANDSEALEQSISSARTALSLVSSPKTRTCSEDSKTKSEGAAAPTEVGREGSENHSV